MQFPNILQRRMDFESTYQARYRAETRKEITKVYVSRHSTKPWTWYVRGASEPVPPLSDLVRTVHPDGTVEEHA